MNPYGCAQANSESNTNSIQLPSEHQIPNNFQISYLSAPLLMKYMRILHLKSDSHSDFEDTFYFVGKKLKKKIYLRLFKK